MAYGIPPIPFIGNLPTPIIRVLDTTAWNLTSPDGSQVERYIVEFECRVQNITFVEKYMSVDASGGTGRVATHVSCSGGLDQLYRVKVWAVSGPNISQQPAVYVVNTGVVVNVHKQCLYSAVCTGCTYSHTLLVHLYSIWTHTDNPSDGIYINNCW